ncbi:hypothetical protein MPH47_06140 [Psychrobacillus psychrodurans]|uniref:hypothetical protein n=1 Tax=Psychrobacillus psychrodurans TaxID=126157 RepID=UPI001F4EA887|nr:hypothetical protein [Psychrobacillus psychrodurans]MCK1996810.1 hypothetical protein [Psychrobacillus psychrodurans]
MQQLNEQQTEQVIRLAKDVFEKSEAERTKKVQDNRLRNVKLLLQNYHNFKVHAERIKEQVSERVAREWTIAQAIEDSHDLLKSVKQTKQRTLAMIGYIDDILEVYRLLCEKSDNVEEQRRYRTIHLRFMQQETIETIATLQNISSRSVYVDIQKSIETLAVLMFGLDSMKTS